MRDMSEPIPIDLVRLRRSCADCSLGELCLPAGVDRDDLGRLDTLVQRRRPLQRGESLFRAGDPLRSVYVASAGAFKTVVVNASGEEHVLGFHLPGELFGLDAIGSGKHRCEAIALGEARVCELPFASLSTVASQLPSLQRQLLRVMGQSADRDHDHVDVLSRRQASERIAMFLHGLGADGRDQEGYSCQRQEYSLHHVVVYRVTVNDKDGCLDRIAGRGPDRNHMV